MSGPNPPESGSGADDPDVGDVPSGESPEEPGEIIEPLADLDADLDAGIHADLDAGIDADLDQTGQTEAYSQAYSAPESEQFTSAPYVPVDPQLYEYDGYGELDAGEAGTKPPRWPWVVGVTAIVAAVALVVSVALLFARTETDELAAPASTVTPTTSLPPVQDEITTTSAAPAPPPPTSEEPPPPPEPETTAPAPVEVPPPPVSTQPPEPATTTTHAPEPTTTTTAPAGPRQITYSVTGTKAPFDQITITYIDSSGQRRTQRNAYIPWSLTLTPISQSEVGSVEASSMLRLSRLNCTITSSDGTVLSSNANEAPQTSC